MRGPRARPLVPTAKLMAVKAGFIACVSDYCERHARRQEDRGMNVGFIGLWHMGAPMAANLLKAGYLVIVYNRTRGKAEALVAKGAQIAARVADACRGEVLITMLSDDMAVEGVIFGDGGALGTLGRNAV